MILEKILDELDEYVYITDLETLDILYANKATLERFHVDSWKGKKCYELLLNREYPCSYPFCKCQEVKKGNVMEWDFFNPIVNRQAKIKDMYLKYNGRPAKLQVAYDISDEQIINEKLSHSLDMEKITIDCLRHIYTEKKPESAISYILAQIGIFLEAERAYIFEIQNNVMNNTCEWCAEGVAPQQDFCQGMDLRLIDMWMEHFERKERCDIFDVEVLKEDHPYAYEALHVQNITSISVSPLFVEGHLYGYVGVDNPNKNQLEHFTMIDTLSYFLGATLERIKMNQELLHASYFDVLTGLYNRNKYSEDVDKLMQKREFGVSIIYVDVNGLKEMNDRFGHRYGDRALCECGQILKRVFSCHSELIYRVGGDEFVVLAENLHEELLLCKIEQLKKEFRTSLYCKGAIGYTHADLNDDLQKKIAEADSNMYLDKQQFYRVDPITNRYRFYNDITLRLKEKSFLLNEIEKKHFEIFLQPKMYVKNRTLMGAEALIRYRDEEGGLILPDQFIPILEDARIIHCIDLYVFKQICCLLKNWDNKGYSLYPISVNFSHHTLLMPDFENRLEIIWDEFKVNKKFIEMEVFEHINRMDPQSLISIIDKIRKAGYLVSMNNFGVKYANMALFINADFDILKADRSLMNDMVENKKSQMLMQSFAKICHELDIKFIAEGVETKAQFDMLMVLGCDGAQGYLFDKPMPIKVFEKKYIQRK